MSRTVRILRRAQDDLTEVAAYLRIEAPLQAERLLLDLFQAFERLAALPESAPLPRDDRLRRLAFRYLACGRYLIFFKVTRAQLRIYRVLHQRRAYDRLL